MRAFSMAIKNQRIFEVLIKSKTEFDWSLLFLFHIHMSETAKVSEHAQEPRAA
jgi:hypothetical protein